MSGMMTGQAVPSKTSARDDEERRMMQMMEQMQQRRAPNAKVAMTPQAQQQMQNFEAARAQAMQPARSVSGGSTTAKPEQAGLLSRLGRGALDALQDPVRQAQIVTALNSMRLQPDPNLAKSMQARASGVQASRQQAQQANRTVEYLKSRGRPDLASAVEANPALAAEALKAVIGVAGDTFATKGFAPQVDPATGQMYGVQYDPNTQTYKRVDVPGAVGETPSEISTRERAAELETADFTRAMKAGQEAFVAAERATGTIDTLNRALSAMARGGASGFVNSYLPSFNEATTTLRQAATEMGIDLIQSATFGALSESELKLALSSTIDLNLPEPELRKLLQDKIRVQTILRNELMRKARELSAGRVKYSDHVDSYKIPGGTEPMIVTQVSPKDLGR